MLGYDVILYLFNIAQLNTHSHLISVQIILSLHLPEISVQNTSHFVQINSFYLIKLENFLAFFAYTVSSDLE